MADGRLSPSWSAGFPDGNKPRWNSGAHFISITGRTDGGKYIVMDPSTQRPQEMTREQLAAFFSPYGNQPHFIPAG